MDGPKADFNTGQAIAAEPVTISVAAVKASGMRKLLGTVGRTVFVILSVILSVIVAEDLSGLACP